MNSEPAASPGLPAPPPPARVRGAHWNAVLAILGLTMLALRLEGRRWWCRCGRPFLWSGQIHSQHNSQHLLDPYSVTHVLHGLLFFAALWWFGKRLSLGARLVIAILLESLWEVVENSRWIIERYRNATIAVGYSGDSVANSLSDIVACVLGFVLASRLPGRWSVVVFALAELILLVNYHDSLLLNILMLVWPIEAIRSWQAGP
jgi:hypothetical protein